MTTFNRLGSIKIYARASYRVGTGFTQTTATANGGVRRDSEIAIYKHAKLAQVGAVFNK